MSTYTFTSGPINIKVLKSSENQLFVEGLVANKKFELTKTGKHTFKFENENQDNFIFVFNPYNSTLALTVGKSNKVLMKMRFQKILE